MERVKLRKVDVLTAENQTALACYLMQETRVQAGALVAINAEKVILADENAQLAQWFLQVEFPYADGISVVKAIQQKYEGVKIERIAGIDLWEILMHRAAMFNVPVFLLGASEAVVQKTAQKWRQQGVNIVGYQHGYFDDEWCVIQQIQQSGAKLVSVAMGSPKQEYFIWRAKQIYPDCLYMGVGGSYDVFVGKVKRAPKVWQQLGLEWLYRLLTQPTRGRRQLRLIKFAWYFLTKQL